MGVEEEFEGEGSSGSLAGDFSLRRAIELMYSLISLSHVVKVFAGKWQVIRNKLEELNSGLVAAADCDSGDSPPLSGLIAAIVATVNDCRDLAQRCVDLSYSGKLLMQSDLDLISARFDRHVRDLAGIYSAGILANGCAIVVSKPSFGANKEDMRFYLKDLLTRMKIGDSGMKTEALAALNEVLIEDDKYGKLLVGIGGSVNLLVNFLDSPEIELQEQAANAVSLISGFESCKGVLIEAGVIAPLIRVLERGSELGKEGAARALQKLTQNADNAWSFSAHDGVTAALTLCAGDGGRGELVCLACGVLKNLSGVEEIKRFMVEEGAISTFVKLAKSKDESLQINSIDALRILAFEDEPIRQLVIKEGGIRTLIRILDPKSSSSYSWKTRETALRAIESLCLSNSPSASSINTLMGYGFLDHLLFLLRNGETSIQQQTLRVAITLSKLSEETKKAMGDVGFMPELVKLLAAKPVDAQEMAAEALAGLVSSSRNRRRFVQDDRNVGVILQMLDPEQGKGINSSSAGNRKKFLLSTVLELSGCNSGRRKIVNSGYVKNIEKLAESEVSDAKRIVKKLNGNRWRSILRGIWHTRVEG